MMTPATILAMELVKQFEGCKLIAYHDASPARVLTVGYGHTGPDVAEGQIISQQEADELLTEDLAKAETGVRRLCPSTLSDKQIAALTSFAFNVGVGALANSHLLYLVRQRAYLEAGKAYVAWDHAGGVEIRGLLIRRLREATMFLEGS